MSLALKVSEKSRSYSIGKHKKKEYKIISLFYTLFCKKINDFLCIIGKKIHYKRLSTLGFVYKILNGTSEFMDMLYGVEDFWS